VSPLYKKRATPITVAERQSFVSPPREKRATFDNVAEAPAEISSSVSPQHENRLQSPRFLPTWRGSPLNSARKGSTALRQGLVLGEIKPKQPATKSGSTSFQPSFPRPPRLNEASHPWSPASNRPRMSASTPKSSPEESRDNKLNKWVHQNPQRQHWNIWDWQIMAETEIPDPDSGVVVFWRGWEVYLSPCSSTGVFKRKLRWMEFYRR